MIHIGNQTAWSAAKPSAPFEFAQAQNFDAFEWFPDKKGQAGWDGADLDQAARRKLREIARTRGMRMSVHARWQANPLKPEGISMLLQDLEMAQDLGAVLLNIHLALDSGVDAFVAAIRPLLSPMVDAGLLLSVENAPDHPPEAFNELFRRLHSLVPGLASNVGMCLDLGHANLCAATRNDYLAYVRRLAPLVPINHVHLHENWGDADSHLTLFTGPAARDDSGIREFLALLLGRRFSGSIILEQWPSPPSLLTQARGRLRQLLDCSRAIPGTVHSTPPMPVVPPRQRAWGALLVEANRQARSWREKLDALRQLLTQHTGPFPDELLADTAIYLRFLSTGEISCTEDGRHFRPAHHSRIGLEIHQRLKAQCASGQSTLLRKILPWLPSSAEQFQRPEPLTRIRDIAHRNDIPSELKHEIKHTLQNKLHRCAGPEDLATSAGILSRILSPHAHYSPQFIAEFKLFHEELQEFFNAQSLDRRLARLEPRLSPEQVQLFRNFRTRNKTETFAEPLRTLQELTQVRRVCQGLALKGELAESEESTLADIGLEDFSFSVSSRLINPLESAAFPRSWTTLLELTELLVANLRLSEVHPEECHAILNELHAWRDQFRPGERDALLRIKATFHRARRLAEAVSSRIVDLFSQRVTELGRGLGVAEKSIRVFCESEVRSHLVFQLARIASVALSQARLELGLSPWDIIVVGEATGPLVFREHLGDQLGTSDKYIVCLNHAEGDEEIPAQVSAVILNQPIPFLSHLAVRARQNCVPLVACDFGEPWEGLRAFADRSIALSVTCDEVKWQAASPESVTNPQRSPPPCESQPVRLSGSICCLPLSEVSQTTAGAKAEALRKLAELSRKPGAGFKVPTAWVLPFGVMESVIGMNPDNAERHGTFLRRVDALPRVALREELSAVRARITALEIDAELAKPAVQSLGHAQPFMVRSSANEEDLEKFSAAGLYETLANVRGAELPAAVRAVWASLFTERAVLSRRQAGVPSADARMAVLIQEMITPQYAFVLHTVNPMTRSPGEAFAEVAVGLGEALVSASIPGTPYRFRCQKYAPEMKMLAFADFSLACWPATEGGLVRRTVDYTKISLSIDVEVRAKLARRLANIAVMLEQSFGAPQDVEGGLLDDQLYLFQSRPQQGLA